jgi:uncharacterized membrane protein YfcA
VFSWILLLAAAFAGGVANALAGGGTFLIFPALLFAGIEPISANATSSVVTTPGGIASAWVYRKGSTVKRDLVLWLIAVSVLGGVIGSQLLVLTPSRRFAAFVPYLMLGAALVFTFSNQLRKYAAKHTPERPHTGLLIAGQFAVAIYGGYFGAGMGVLTIVVFTIAAGLGVQQSAGLRMWCATGVNALAVLNFVLRGLVNWRTGMPMLVAAIVGGTLGAHTFRRLDPEIARRLVLVYAWIMTLWLLIRSFL